MVTTEAVMGALSRVQEPELHKDLVTLNMVKDVSVNGGDVKFTIELTTPACPLRGQIESEAKAAVLRLDGVQAVNVNFTANVSRRSSLTQGQLVPQIKNVIAVASGKGGVGKSSVSVNLAIALQQSGARVGILDADVHGPNIPLMLGIAHPPGKTGDNKILPPVRYGIQAMSIGFMLAADAALIWRGPMVHSAIQQFLSDVAWGDLDYLVIDLPPGTGDASLTVAQLLPSARAVIVSTPQNVALMDAGRALAMFRKLNVPVLGIVENMSYYQTPTGERIDIFGHGGARDAADKQGLRFLGEIALDPAVRIGGDTGKPITVTDPDSPTSKAFRDMAAQVAAAVSVANAEEEAPVIIS